MITSCQSFKQILITLNQMNGEYSICIPFCADLKLLFQNGIRGSEIEKEVQHSF